MKIIKQYIAVLIGCLIFFSCSNDKEYTTDMPEAELINKISIDNFKSSVLYLGVGMDSTLVWSLGSEEIADKSVIWKSSNESIATVSQDGKISAISTGEAIITIAPSIGFGGVNAVKSIPVTVVPEIVKTTSIVFTNTETSVYQTANLPLVYNILPANHTYDYLTWSSSDESIAVVDEKGVVTGVKAGTVTITAQTHDRSGVRGSIEITVLESVTATDISINANQEFALYETYPLNFTLTPANATTATVEWKSSDTSVASINSDGKITTHKFGTTKITAKTPNGKQAEATITVAEGFFRKDFSDGTIFPWAVQNGASASFSNGKMIVTFGSQNADKYRGDFVLANNGLVNNVTLNVGTYRYFAMKMLAANKLVTNSNGNGCVVLDTNNGRYNQPVGNGNNNYFTYLKNNGTWVWNQPAVYSFDLQEVFGNSGYKYPTTGTADLSTFKFVMADYPKATSSSTYEIYWVRSFKTLEELKAFVDNE